MKIGILTYHRAHNYGAVLQCYALKQTLASFGHEVFVLDYRQSNIENMYTYHKYLSMRAMIIKCLLPISSIFPHRIQKRISKIYNSYLRKSLFESFQKNYFNLLPIFGAKMPSNIDVFVIGSDMLWADDCMQGNFDQIYLGYFEHSPNATLIGYAISGTPSSFEKLGKVCCFDFLRNFKAISVREKLLGDIMSKYTGIESTICIDPTLLTTKETWAPLVKNEWGNKKYIVTYFLRLPAESIIGINNIISAFAKQKNCEVINIDVTSKTKPLSIEDFLSIIANAKHVITDSFHGIIFSIIFHRSFQAIMMNDYHDARYVDILEYLELQQTLSNTNIVPKLQNINYQKVDEKIANYRQFSMDFLSTNL